MSTPPFAKYKLVKRKSAAVLQGGVGGSGSLKARGRGTEGQSIQVDVHAGRVTNPPRLQRSWSTVTTHDSRRNLKRIDEMAEASSLGF